ncbi:hypothetical protein SMD44_08250 [Streptomyces alboflavus]|uniref:Uncharacterized protein n=1 Tax=Streptomyces alboflavus TaxID=67267 RepID=A0A1Z1WQP7_9ACTN|nr:hypothetical protein SMD44_08250 [Streptomyces alboflavus]
MAEGVGGVDDRGLAVVGADGAGGLLLEEVLAHPDAAGGGDVGDRTGGLHAQMPDAGLGDRREHDPVVAAEFDDERVVAGQFGADETLGDAPEVFPHSGGSGGMVRVMIVEHALARHFMEKLHHRARFTGSDDQPVEVFGIRRFRRQEAVRYRLFPEVHEGDDLTAADAARGRLRHIASPP